MPKRKFSSSTREIFKYIEDDAGKRLRTSPLIKLKTLPATKQSQSLEKRIISANKTKKSNSSLHPRTICHQIYNFLQDTAQLIVPEMDIKIGNVKTINLSSNGAEKFKTADINLNSYLLFSHLNFLVNGAMLYVGPPGTGKTTASELVAHYMFGTPLKNIRESVIYGHPELTFGDMVATLDLGQLLKYGKEKVIPRDFMLSEVRIIDEVNRIPPGKLSILYQVVDRGMATFKNEYILAPKGPLFATANESDSGNYNMPPPFMDRFDIVVNSKSMNPLFFNLFSAKNPDKLEIALDNTLKTPPHLDAGSLEIARSEIDKVQIEDIASRVLAYFLSELNYCDKGGRAPERKTKDYTVNKKPGALCVDCHYNSDKNICNQTKNPISPRTYRSINSFAKAFGWWIGKNKVGLEEMSVLLPFALKHKIIPTNIALEKDSHYSNDRNAFIEDLFEKSRRSYEMLSSKAPELALVSDMIVNFYTKGKNSGVSYNDVMDILKNNVKKIDSPVKNAYAVALYNIAMGLK